MSIASHGGWQGAVPHERAGRAELGAVMLAGLPALHTINCPPVSDRCTHPWARGCGWGGGELLCPSRAVQQELGAEQGVGLKGFNLIGSILNALELKSLSRPSQ